MTGDHFNNCVQDALSDADIGDVVLMHRRLRQQVRWGSLEDAVSAMLDRGPGRPEVGDVDLNPLRVPSALRDALRARAEKEGVSLPDLRRRAYDTYLNREKR